MAASGMNSFEEVLQYRIAVYTDALEATLRTIRPIVQANKNATVLSDAELKALFDLTGKVIDRIFDGIDRSLVPDALNGKLPEIKDVLLSTE